jgi:pimeloyl-ACP methyl ester carboxylesterase
MHGTVLRPERAIDGARAAPGVIASIEYAGGLHCLEAGAGPLVVLVHSSMSGARQWSRLIGDLANDFRVKAVNLFGYGQTPAWSKPRPSSLGDFGDLVAAAVPAGARDIHLVGHSLGGAVAMHAAAHALRGRVARLVLIEPSLFALLDQCGRHEAYCEISTVLDYTNQCILDGSPAAAAECFMDYWWGVGAWAATPAARRLAFAGMASRLSHEAGALLQSETRIEDWIAALPRDALVLASRETTRPSRELAEALLRARPDWASASISEGGHMAPVSHPELVNPLIRAFVMD